MAGEKIEVEKDESEEEGLKFCFHSRKHLCISPPSFSHSLCFCFSLCYVWEFLNVFIMLFLQLQENHPPPPHTTHTHTPASKVLSAHVALEVCERIRLRGERGPQVKEGVMFVSVSGENCWSGTFNVNILTASG